MTDKRIREQLVALLRGEGAHRSVETALRDFPQSLAGERIGQNPHTPWRLLEHMRIAQWDILEFCRNPHHVSPDFPDGYWPPDDAPPTAEAWSRSVDGFCSDLAAMRTLVEDPGSDLVLPIPHGNGQTLIREALLVADHNSYHLGQLLLIWHGVKM